MTLTALGLFLGAWALSNAITPQCIRLAERWGVLDRPDARKVHSQPIPRFGGVAIYTTLALIVVLGVVFVPILQGAFLKDPGFYLSVAGAATAVFLVGLYDDVRNASIWVRFVIEFAAAFGIIFIGGVLIENATIPFIGSVPLGAWSVPVTVFWIVGMTNALNIIDGLDGLAGGVSFIACFGVFIVAVLNGQPMAMASMAILAGATLGFLRYNSHPARIFLGDSGSLLLGFLLAVIAIDTSMKRSTSMALIIPMLMLAVPLLDTLYSMSRRLAGEVIKRKNYSPRALLAMFRSDREHIHHSLLDVGFSHPAAVWILYLLSAVVMSLGLYAAVTMDDKISLLFLFGSITGFLFIRHFGGSLPFFRRWKKTTDAAGEQDETPEESPPRATPLHGTASPVDPAAE